MRCLILIQIVSYTPYGDHFAMHCGMEIVLPSGELLRTGMGALPGKDGEDSPTWQSFQNSFGPKIDGIFSQSNYGVVVKMGMWLMPATEHQSYMLTFPRDEDFEHIVDIIRPLALNKVLGNVPQLRHVIQELAITGQPKSSFYNGKGQIPREAIREAAKKLPIGDVSWVFYGCQYGDRATISAQLELIKEAFLKIPGSKFYLPSDVPQDHYLLSRERVCSGVPVLTELNWLNWVPNGGHLSFSPITPCQGKDARIVHEIITAIHKKYDVDVFTTLCVAGREVHYISEIGTSSPILISPRALLQNTKILTFYLHSIRQGRSRAKTRRSRYHEGSHRRMCQGGLWRVSDTPAIPRPGVGNLQLERQRVDEIQRIAQGRH